MLVRLSTVIAAICMLSVAALAQDAKNLNDPQIVQIAYTIGHIDIMGAEQALSKSSNGEVRAFAADMMRSHKAASSHLLDLSHTLKLTSKDDDISRALTEKAADKRIELSKLNGAKFDTAYIASEVAYYIFINGLLEISLAPSASNPELKNLLQNRLDFFRGSHQHAKKVASTLEDETPRNPSSDGGK
jgi:putative membrane protein